jgi:hypothetical protein
LTELRFSYYAIFPQNAGLTVHFNLHTGSGQTWRLNTLECGGWKRNTVVRNIRAKQRKAREREITVTWKHACITPGRLQKVFYGEVDLYHAPLIRIADGRQLFDVLVIVEVNSDECNLSLADGAGVGADRGSGKRRTKWRLWDGLLHWLLVPSEPAEDDADEYRPKAAGGAGGTGTVTRGYGISHAEVRDRIARTHLLTRGGQVYTFQRCRIDPSPLRT